VEIKILSNNRVGKLKFFHIIPSKQYFLWFRWCQILTHSVSLDHDLPTTSPYASPNCPT
jgi:hypothetical protein